MDEQIVRSAYAAYGFPDVKLFGSEKGYRNTSLLAQAGSQSLNLILYKDEPGIAERIKRTNLVGDYVTRAGLPARRTLDPRILQLKTPTQDRYASLYTYLPGDTIPWDAYTQKHLKVLGMALGRLHTATRTLVVDKFPNIIAEYIEICNRMRKYYDDTNVEAAMHDKLSVSLSLEKLDAYMKLLRACEKLSRRQVLHMDFVRSNVLFSEESSVLTVDGVSVSGILDFEKAAVGHPVFDVARTLSFLLVDCKYKTVAKIRKYFLESGYAKRGGQSLYSITLGMGEMKVDVLEELVSLFLLYDVYKFMRHNPYEFLAENEHYVRTRDLLIARKVLVRL